MTLIRRPSPFGELMSLRQAMDRRFEDSYVRPTRSILSGMGDFLPLDIRHDRDELVVEAALPGVKPEDVEITVEQGTLTIHAVSSEAREPGKEAGEYLLQEIRRGETTRTVTLPTGLEPEQAEATFENGILTLRIPRAESVKPRQIRINPRAQVTGETTRPTGTTADPDAEHATVGAGSAH